jgi:hypothetical protein
MEHVQAYASQAVSERQFPGVSRCRVRNLKEAVLFSLIVRPCLMPQGTGSDTPRSLASVPASVMSRSEQQKGMGSSSNTW